MGSHYRTMDTSYTFLLPSYRALAAPPFVVATPTFIDQPAVIEKSLTYLRPWPAQGHNPPGSAAALRQADSGLATLYGPHYNVNRDTLFRGSWDSGHF